MSDSKASFTFARRVRRVGGRSLAHIVLGGAKCTRNRRLGRGRVALQFVIDTYCSAASSGTTTLRCHFCHPRAAHPGEEHVQYVRQRIRPFWRLSIGTAGGWYE